jgi:glycosyltransferase involved in cell wall biosynthesis
VAHCIWDTAACGAQQVLRVLLSELDPARFESTVFTFEWGEVADLIVEHGIEVIELRPRVRKLDPSLVWRLRRQLRRGGYQVLHTHLFGAHLHGSLAALGLGDLRSVMTLHSVREDNQWQRWAYGSLLPRADRVVACSAEVAAVMGSRYAASVDGRLRTIPNGIDAARFGVLSKARARSDLELEGSSAVIVAIGRLSEPKGYPVLVKAMPLLLARIPAAMLLIAGEGPLRPHLESLVASLGIGAHVRFLGLRRDVPRILAAGDVFALSSLWEGLPMVLLEAMAAGLPCVATRVGGVPEAIRDREEGLLVPPGDAEALAESLISCLEDRDLATRLTTRAKARVDRDFSARRMADEYASLYEELIAASRGRRARPSSSSFSSAGS